MASIYFCTINQHQPWLVALAALICLATALSGMLLFGQARATAQMRWLLAAGAASGFGLWATHFVAMMGYTPGIAFSYRAMPTMASLGLAVVLVTGAFGTAARSSRRRGALLAGMFGGIGVAEMHYTGIAALDMPARIEFDPVLVAASIGWIIALMIPAFRLAQVRLQTGRPRLRQVALPSGLLALSVVGLHFTGMAAIRLIPSRMTQADAALLSPAAMSGLVSVAAVSVLVICLLALFTAWRVQAELAAKDRNFSILVKGISDCALYMLTPEGHVANWNAGAERMKGYSRDQIVGQSMATFYTEEDRQAGLPQMVLATALDEGKFVGEGWRCRADGSRFWAHVTVERIHDSAGGLIGFAKITRDVTRQKEAQDRLAAMRLQLDTALDNMHQGLALFDADERLVLSNERLRAQWGLGDGDLVPGMALDAVLRRMMEGQRVADHAVHAQLEAAMTSRATGTTIVCREDFVIALASRALPAGGWVTTFEDVTERRRSEERIAYLAGHDPLTGLPNRMQFGEWCAREMDHARRHGQNFAMIAIDFDRFKEINDSWGHADGDHVIATIATRFREAAGEDEMVARLGGDEFAAGKVCANESELLDFVDRLSACFARPVESAGREIPASASFGVAVCPTDAATLETLLNNADLAMYRAKSGHGERICFYQAGMDENARTRRQIAGDLRYAIERGEFHLLYQPQHSVLTGERTGFEALLRWRHPVRGLVSPMEFIPIAEETGAIFAIGEWVLREAAREAAGWDNGLKVAVNLSPVQLQRPDLVLTIAQILIDSGLPPHRLELEITESAIIADKARALHMLRQIKALGIAIAMDDFGTGYSSLDTLHSFPFDKIKIDKSFLMQSSESDQAAAIVRAVLALGRSLHIPVLAEGVETSQQLAFLADEGCDEAQGYYFGKPQPIRLPDSGGKTGREESGGEESAGVAA